MLGCRAWDWKENDEVQIAKYEQVGVHLLDRSLFVTNIFEFEGWGKVLSCICVVFLSVDCFLEISRKGCPMKKLL